MPDTPAITPPVPPVPPNGPPNPRPDGSGDSYSGGPGIIVDQQIERELHDSYLTYAMSTIMDRALPDVRDGLKPSQRRILVAMNDLNLTPGRKHIKCAKICGDTSGNYHPHGEQVIYPTLVNLGQEWKTRALLIDKQGNFGSIDGDPPAAMRYTEARMTHAAVALLQDIKLETVDFKPNYDDRLQEPTVLPGKFPNLLINGSSGIAVGMASSIPPHNPTEICNAIIAVIDNPEIKLKELMEIVSGPDFPTGGIIRGKQGITEAYGAGRGRISVRGRVHFEEAGNRTNIVIDEIPYQLVQINLIEKIVDAAKEGRIPDISDVKNFSGKTHRTRIVVYLKRGADPAVVEKQLYQFTPLQSTFSIINIALVSHRPKALGLRPMIQCYIDHRKDVIRRRTEHLLREAKKNAHKLEGLIYAVCDIDEVIVLIRASQTREEAIEKLMARRFRISDVHPHAAQIPKRLMDQAGRDGGAELTRVQAEAIGGLRLIQLVGLEIEKLVAEYAKLVEEIEGYERILADEKLVLGIIRSDAIEMREKFGTPRLTLIEDAEADVFDTAELVKEHTVAVTISHQGYAKRSPIEMYREQGRGGRGIIGSDTKDDDFVEHLFVASTHDDLLCFTNTGRVFKMKVFQIPEMSRTAKGRAIVNLIELRADERVVAFLNIADFERSEDYLFFATAQGKVKRTALQDYRNVHRSGINAINLNEGDRLIDVIHTTGHNHVLLATASGMSIRFDENDARVMGRNAAGVKGIELHDGDQVVGMIQIEQGDDEADLLTITENGYGKRTSLVEYLVQSEDGSTRPQSRGGKGRHDIKTTERNGNVVAVRGVKEGDSLMFISQGGMLVRVAAKTISRIGRNTQGVRLVNLKEGDKLIAAARVADSDMSGEKEPDALPPAPSLPPTPN
ncbi:MAG: DNA gyrase subunit A [Phycisphaerales bacterium]|nr:DNA gyrase subunit A [Phycisphaerales bacterium]